RAQCGGATISEVRSNARVKSKEFSLCDRPEALPSLGQIDAHRAPVLGVPYASHKPRSFHETDHGCHRLFRQPDTRPHLAHAEAIRFEQWDEHRSIGWPYLAVALTHERIGEQLVPSLRRLREQVSDVGASAGVQRGCTFGCAGHDAPLHGSSIAIFHSPP